jgi:hypothetical protein
MYLTQQPQSNHITPLLHMHMHLRTVVLKGVLAGQGNSSNSETEVRVALSARVLFSKLESSRLLKSVTWGPFESQLPSSDSDCEFSIRVVLSLQSVSGTKISIFSKEELVQLRRYLPNKVEFGLHELHVPLTVATIENTGTSRPSSSFSVDPKTGTGTVKST